MGRVDKGVKCSVSGCSESAVRSISFDKVKAAGLKIIEGRRAYLCRNHYREFKRKSRNSRKVEKWRWSV